MTRDQSIDEPFSLAAEEANLAPSRKNRSTLGPAVFKDFDSSLNQRKLFAHNAFDLLPEDHDCFLFAELFTQLDTREAENATAPLVSAPTVPNN